LLWNLLGCVAYISDVTLKPEDIAKMSAAQQALYASRPAWAVAATAIAVWGGAAGCIGLILRKRWATPLLVASLAGVVAQDVGLFLLSGLGGQVDVAVFALQGLVLLVAIGLVVLARKASAREWLT
jgi:anti-sigma-K factor RskA